MSINRREFVILSSVLAAGCTAEKTGVSEPAAAASGTVDAGPAADYAADGVYPRFRDSGFFLVRRGDKLFALSSYCTHRRCKLAAEPDRSFYCKCHGSTFDPSGKVTDGPATKDLPGFVVTQDTRGHVVVTMNY